MSNLEKIKEKAAGKFVVSGKIFDGKGTGKGEKRKGKRQNRRRRPSDEEDSTESEEDENKNSKNKNEKPKDKGRIELDLTTARGIILLNVNPTEVPSDLRERPLTDAAKAIIRSGDSLLTEAIRRASPKYFGDYAKTLPPIKREPVLAEEKNLAKTL